MSPIFAMLRAAVVEAEGCERELAQARADIIRLANENQEQCDRIAELEQELANVRAARADA